VELIIKQKSSIKLPDAIIAASALYMGMPLLMLVVGVLALLVKILNAIPVKTS
jgi:hypothetical protein